MTRNANSTSESRRYRATGGSDWSEDEKINRSSGSGRRDHFGQSQIPAIAIQDVGDSYSDEDYHSGLGRLHRQVLEADMNKSDVQEQRSRDISSANDKYNENGVGTNPSRERTVDQFEGGVEKADTEEEDQGQSELDGKEGWSSTGYESLVDTSYGVVATSYGVVATGLSLNESLSNSDDQFVVVKSEEHLEREMQGCSSAVGDISAGGHKSDAKESGHGDVHVDEAWIQMDSIHQYVDEVISDSIERVKVELSSTVHPSETERPLHSRQVNFSGKAETAENNVHGIAEEIVQNAMSAAIKLLENDGEAQRESERESRAAIHSDIQGLFRSVHFADGTATEAMPPPTEDIIHQESGVDYQKDEGNVLEETIPASNQKDKNTEDVSNGQNQSDISNKSGNLLVNTNIPPALEDLAAATSPLGFDSDPSVQPQRNHFNNETMTEISGQDLKELGVHSGFFKESTPADPVIFDEDRISERGEEPCEEEEEEEKEIVIPAVTPTPSELDQEHKMGDVATLALEPPPALEPRLERDELNPPQSPSPGSITGDSYSVDEFPKYKSRSTASSFSSPVERKSSKKGMLHKGSSASLTSLYSTGEEFYGKYPITGDVSFGLGYNFKTNVFEVKIGGCRDLVPIDIKKIKSDPYIKTYLLPDKSKDSKRKTKIKKGTINPNYSETLKYSIAQSELETRTLSVAVWHYDRFGRNMFLGEVLLPLDGVSLTNYPTKWHQLMARVPPSETKPISYKGDIILALMFETLAEDNANGATSRRKKKGPSARQIGGCLKVHIKEAKNLTSARMSGSAHPYVKLYLQPDKSKGGKKKTSVMKGTINPVYEQRLEFTNMTEDILKERALEVGIWDNEAVGSSSFMGGVRLGPGTGKSYGRAVEWQDSTGIEIQLWEEMLTNHNKWVEACLPLRASFNIKT